MAPVKGPPLLVERIAARIRTIGGRRMGGWPLRTMGGAGGAVPQGLKGCSSGATERCAPRVWNLGEIFNNGTIVDDDDEEVH